MRAAALAEQRWALPRNLLLAIGEVETGRRDAATGATQPWPWSANAQGSEYVFASPQEASAVVGFLLERGIASIDVGCFQVNLHHHPAAFASLAQGFDPYSNADYAARFLRRLFEQSGSWSAAIGDYHSADPALGAAYRGKVLRALASLGGGPLMQGAHSPTGEWAEAIPVYTPCTAPAEIRFVLHAIRPASCRDGK